MATREEKSRLIPKIPWVWISVAVGCYCFFAWIYSFFGGGFCGDEGFYALAARNVLEGMKPYRDFGLSQMPLMPYWYGAWFALVGSSIEAGRVLSAAMGAGSVALIGLACYRRGGRIAGIVGALLIGCNLHFIIDTLAIKTQSLTVFLTSCAIFVLAKPNARRPLLQAALAMLFLTLALLSRLSILPMLLLLWLYLGWKLRRSLGAFAALWLVNLAVLAGVYAFFRSEGNMVYWILQFHQEYSNFQPWTWERLVPTIHSWLGNELAIILFFFCATWVFVAKLVRGKRFLEDDTLLFLAFLLLSYWGATALHWMNVQSYATHQTSIIAFAVVFGAVGMAPLLEKLCTEDKGLWAFAFAALLWLTPSLGEIGMTLAINLEGNQAMKGIHEASSILRQYAKEGDSILSFSSELAVNGGYKVPSGYEVNEFGYFPGMTDERCAKLHTLNLKKLSEDISSGKHKILCIEDRLFSLMAAQNQEIAGQLKQRIDQRYRQVGVVKNYGQFNLTLYIFALRE